MLGMEATMRMIEGERARGNGGRLDSGGWTERGWFVMALVLVR
jgi:hypothetical protein